MFPDALRRVQPQMTLYPRIVRNLLYPLDLWRTGDGAELRYLREFERTQYLPADVLRQRTLEKLRSMVAHAYERCPFYRVKYRATSVNPDSIASYTEFAALPVLKKVEIQTRRDDMVAASWPRNDLILDQTGGSTGTPISFFMNRDRKWSRSAAARRHDRWAGYDIGDKVALIWGAPRDLSPQSFKQKLRNHLIDRRLILDTANITESTLQGFNQHLKRFRPRIIVAYARSLALFARFIQSRQYQAYQPEAIITSAEVLTPDDRTLVEGVFGCPVFNRYGCREFSVIASECSAHIGLHIMGEGLYVEVVKDGQVVAPGEAGEILVTDLLNVGMPMIRYRIGDMAVHEDTQCPCGRGLPRLRNIQGRVTDFVVGSDGRLVSGVFLATYIVAHRPSLGQVQLWQDAVGRLLYKICTADGGFPTKEDLEYLHRETRKYVGDDTKVEFELVSELKSEPSGKFIFCHSRVRQDL